MGKYENILKTLDEAIARKDSDIEWYKEQYHKSVEEVTNLTKANEVLTKKIKDLEEELDFYKPKMVKGEQAK